MKSVTYISAILSTTLFGFVSNVGAFTITTNSALPAEQCTEFRDGSRVYESKYIYLNTDGTYTNESGTYPSIYLKDAFYNYGDAFVIR